MHEAARAIAGDPLKGCELPPVLSRAIVPRVRGNHPIGMLISVMSDGAMIATRRLRKRLTGLSVVVGGLLLDAFGSAAAHSAAPPPAAPIEQPPIEPAETQPVAQPVVQLATHQPTATLWSVEGQLGLGMPLGALGLEASYRPLPALALAVGMGRSLFGNTQVGAMPRLDLVRLFNQKMVLSVGAGVSYGDCEQDSAAGLGSDEFIPNTLWGNFEISDARTSLSREAGVAPRGARTSRVAARGSR